jgi:hypothetical protein
MAQPAIAGGRTFQGPGGGGRAWTPFAILNWCNEWPQTFPHTGGRILGIATVTYGADIAGGNPVYWQVTVNGDAIENQGGYVPAELASLPVTGDMGNVFTFYSGDYLAGDVDIAVQYSTDASTWHNCDALLMLFSAPLDSVRFVPCM